MFALTVSNGSARLLGLIVCISSTCVSASWILGPAGENCLAACSNISQVCTEAELMLHNGDVNSKSAMSNVVESQLGNCTKYNTKYGQSSDVPVYQPSSGECYVSAADRDIGSFSCLRAPPVGKQRLCWCHNSSSQVESAEGVLAQVESAEGVLNDESSPALSNQTIVVLISSAMLFVAFVGMAFAIVRRLRKRSQGIPEKVKERPKDSGFYIRCPNCGCPVGESRSVKSWAANSFAPADGTASAKSTNTKASAKSNRTNSPPTHCPACGCELTNLDGSHTEASKQSTEFDVTVSRAFKPGGFFIDLEEGSDGMGKLKMGDCDSPSHPGTRTAQSPIIKGCTPKSALRKSAPADSLPLEAHNAV